MFARICLLLAATTGASGVALGAYHAHGLEKFLTKQGPAAEELKKRMDNCEVAVRYQMYHGLALAILGATALWASHNRLAVASAALFTTGMIGFSGGLYWMVFTGTIGHWAIVPSGGLMLIMGWLLFGLAALGRADSSGGE